MYVGHQVLPEHVNTALRDCRTGSHYARCTRIAYTPAGAWDGQAAGEQKKIKHARARLRGARGEEGGGGAGAPGCAK